MARRLILYGVIPLIVSSPPHHAFETTAFSLITRKDKIDEAGHACDAVESFLTKFDEPAKIRVNVLEFRGHETRDGSFWFRYRESERCDEVTLTLGDLESRVGDAMGEFLAEFDETERACGDVLGFGGHVTRDWGYWFRVSERGPEKYMETVRS